MRSYSEAGEDLIALALLGEAPGTYVDVGAHLPVQASNTCLFYENGWSGTCIEPVRTLYEALGAARPRDLCLHLAASNHDGETTFYECRKEPDLSTTSALVATGLKRDGYTLDAYTVLVRSLRSLAAEHGIASPDLLSIDVEGLEKEVLEGTPFERWHPRVIIMESTVPRTFVPSYEPWEPLLLAQGYRLHTAVHVNRIYIRA